MYTFYLFPKNFFVFCPYSSSSGYSYENIWKSYYWLFLDNLLNESNLCNKICTQAHNQFLQIMARRPWEEIQQILVIFLQYILMQLRKSLDQDWIFLLSWIAPRTQQEHNLIFISIFSGNHQCCRDQYANIACFQGLLISRIIFRSFSLLR